MANKKKETGIGGKIHSSIVFKLNARLFLRMLAAFLLVDALLLAALAVGTLAYSENSLASVAAQVEKYGLPDSGASRWLRPQGITAAKVSKAPQGMQIPSFLRNMFPRATADAARSITAPARAKAADKLQNLTYSLVLNRNPERYQISISLAGVVRIFRTAVIPLLIAQILILSGGLFSGAKEIRRTLRPISELAEATESLNKASGEIPFAEMEKLAGKLNDISVSKLDTHIPVASTQKELRNLAVSINNMLDRINASYQSQIRFVSDASHELRTPIAVIQGYANLLDRWGKNDAKTMQESITAIKEETDNMKLLVEQLLFLARGDNDTMRLQMERFDLSALAREVIGEMQMIDGGHEYAMKLSPADIRADKALIKQCMRILTDNAVKYTPAGGHIQVAVFSTGEDACLSVQDDGIGIPPQSVPRIFDRFYRAEESRARATGGTGLGLSIAKWIAERHGGRLEVLSRENIGTRLSMILPLAKEKAEDGVFPPD